MLLTTPLLAKGSSFFGSLLNKCRQVYKLLPLKDTSNQSKSNENTIIANIPTPLPIQSSSDNKIDTKHNSRPAAVASISLSSTVSAKTMEEKIGLPPRPKKPLTPYFRFMKDLRAKVSAENPNVRTMEVVRLISKQWETADPSIKQRLQEEYKSELQSYVERRTKYEAKITDEQRAEISQLKKDKKDIKERKLLRQRIKALGRPKKPSSAFLLFVAAERIATPQLPKQTYREWHQNATIKWGSLTDAEKAPYMQAARKELIIYKKEISEWEEKMVRLGHIDVVRHGNLIDPPEPKPKKQ